MNAPERAQRVILDADTANEIDDLYAIVRALIAPEFLIEGLQSAPFSPATTPNETVRLSQEINEDILSLMGLTDRVPALLGAAHSMPDPNTPVESPAAWHIIERAHAGSPDDPLLVIASGQCTNLASALLLDPTIAPKVRFAFIDGDYHEGRWAPGTYNWVNDIQAVRAIFDSDVPYFHMPAPHVSGKMKIPKRTGIERLEGRGGVYDYILNRWLVWEMATTRDPWTMWDIALVEAFLRPHLATAVETGAPIVHSASRVEQYPDNPRRVTVFADIDNEGMEQDFWTAIERALSGGPGAHFLGS